MTPRSAVQPRPSVPSSTYLSWWWPNWGRWGWRQQCSHGQISFCARQSCGDGSRSDPCWAADAHGRGSEHPASWGSPVCRCLHWCAPHSPEKKNTVWNLLLHAGRGVGRSIVCPPCALPVRFKNIYELGWWNQPIKQFGFLCRTTSIFNGAVLCLTSILFF